VMTYVAVGPLGPRPAKPVSADQIHWRRLGPMHLAYQPDLDTAVGHFHLVPPQPCDNDWMLDHVARTSLRRVDGGWTSKFDPRLYTAREGASRPSDFGPELARASCRIALVNGEHSDIVDDDVRSYMAELLADSPAAVAGVPFVEVPEARHHLLLDQPLAVVTALRGILAGWRGGWWDTLITYFANLLDSFPRLVLILLVIAAFKPDIYYVMVVVGITSMPVIASLVAGKIAFLRQKSFIEAAHVLGLPTRVIVVKHILWYNCAPLLIIQATLGMAEAILVETSLSYLGFGVQEPTPSWGNMLRPAWAQMRDHDAWWMGLFPGLAIALTVLAFNFVGDGIRDALDPRSRLE
jgi:hypothetical protein